jgi:hypothetical protein
MEPGALRTSTFTDHTIYAHTFATWLEDAGIPSRVIDEVMGYAGGRRLEQGSRMGRVYRETTPAMLIRVVRAIEDRLAVVLDIAKRERPSGT